MTPPPDSGGQVNPFGMPPLMDADDAQAGPFRASSPSERATQMARAEVKPVL